MHGYDHCSMIYDSLAIAAISEPINRWMDKDGVACTQM